MLFTAALHLAALAQASLAARTVLSDLWTTDIAPSCFRCDYLGNELALSTP